MSVTEQQLTAAADGSGAGLAIWAEGLVKHFDKVQAVNGVDLEVKTGEFFGFVGPNGAGKTTTIKMLIGALRPTAGQARVAGFDVAAQPLEVKRRIGVMPEEPALYERLTGREFVIFAGQMHGLTRDEAYKRTDDLFELIELGAAADRLIVDYSHGMRKKVALSAAVIHAPQVLFLDEPFQGVDAVSGRVVRDVLKLMVRRGATVFFTSHIMETVERLCDRMAVIDHGRVVGVGTLETLRARAAEGAHATLEDVFVRLVRGSEEETVDLEWL